MTNTTNFDDLPPWDGKESNYVTIFALIATSLAWMAVAGRLFARRKFTTFGLDDWLVIPAMLLVTANTFMACYADLRAGIGRPLWTVSEAQFTIWFKCTLASSFLYPVMMSTVRISVLLFYRRLIGPTYQTLQYCIKGLILMTIPYVVTYEFLLGFMCKPPSSFWKPFQRNADCGDVYYYKLHITLYSVSLIFDLLILVLPLKAIWELKMQKRQRVLVCGLIALGASACFGIAYRLALWVLEMKRYPHIDPRWSANPLSKVIPPQFDRYGWTYWVPSLLESNMAIIGASLPALKPLLTQYNCLQRGKFSKFSQGGSGGMTNPSDTKRSHGIQRPGPYSEQIGSNNDSVELLHVDAVGGAYAGTYPVKHSHVTTIKADVRDDMSTDSVLPGSIVQTSTVEVRVSEKP